MVEQLNPSDARGNGEAHRPASFIQEHVRELNENASDPSFRVSGAPPNFGQYSVPHVLSFQGLFGTFSRVYRPSDEAIKDSLENARFMRNDPGVMECIEQRQRATSLLEWTLEPEDQDSDDQKQLCAELEKILRRIPQFTEYRNNLLHALWYGRYAIQHRYRWVNVGGRMRVMPAAKGDNPGWLPINGDKLVFRYDDGMPGNKPDQVGIRVGSRFQAQDRINGRWNVEPTERGLAYFLEDWERPLLAIHKHIIEDGAWEEGIDAGMIHGVGIRSRIYWDWFQKQEALAFLMEYLERSAGGIEIWEYPAGNKEALDAAQTAAKERISNQRNIVFFPKPQGAEGDLYNLHVIEPGMAGIESLKDILVNYYGHRIKRYILGQTLTSEAEATGLGSGVAELHLDTFLQIIKYDATKLEETVTTDLVTPIKNWNFPHARDILVRFKIQTESSDIEKKLEAWARAYEMGAALKESDVMDLIGASMPGEGDTVLRTQDLQGPPQPGGLGNNGSSFGPLGNLQSASTSPKRMTDEVLNSLFGDPEKLNGRRMTYVAEGGKWVEREVPEFDTGDRSREGEYGRFDETKHPRESDGRFSGKGSKASGSRPNTAGTSREDGPGTAIASSTNEEWKGHAKRIFAQFQTSLNQYEDERLSPEKKQAYLKTAESVLLFMSEESLRRMRQNMQRVEFYDTVSSLTEGVRGTAVVSQGRHVGGAWARTPGFPDGVLHLDGGSDTNEDYAGTTRDIYAHEFAHAIDFTPSDDLQSQAQDHGQTFAKSTAISDSPEWKAAWQQEIDLATEPLSRYARRNSSEGFAEFGRFVFTQPRVAREMFPKCWQTWRSRGLV